MTNPVQAHELIEDLDYVNDRLYNSDISSLAFYGMPNELMELLLQQAVKNRKVQVYIGTKA